MEASVGLFVAEIVVELASAGDDEDPDDEKGDGDSPDDEIYGDDDVGEDCEVEVRSAVKLSVDPDSVEDSAEDDDVSDVSVDGEFEV